MLKALEGLAKTILALIAGAILFRPFRRRAVAQRLMAARRVLLVRIDRRVGEALLTTPLISALAQSPRDWEVDVVVDSRCVALLKETPGLHRVLPFNRGMLALGPLAPGIRELRKARYDILVDCSNWTAPSVTAALVTRLSAGSGVVVGPQGSAVSSLRDVPVAPRSDTRSEVLQRLNLLAPLIGQVPELPLTFRSVQGEAPSESLRTLASGAPFAVVNPGGRLGWRRVPPEVFVAAGRALQELGLRVVVTWGPGEQSLAEEVTKHIFDAVQAPPTTLDELAWVIGNSKAMVCNNTGPMHLSVAIGTPTLGLFLRMEPERWGHHKPPHKVLDLTPDIDSGRDAGATVRAAVTELVQSARANAGRPN